MKSKLMLFDEDGIFNADFGSFSAFYVMITLITVTE